MSETGLMTSSGRISKSRFENKDVKVTSFCMK